MAGLPLALVAGCSGEPEIEKDCSATPPAYLTCVAPIMEESCLTCHSSLLVDADRQGADVGVDFDTEADLATFAERILLRAVIDDTMPPAGPMLPGDQTALEAYLLPLIPVCEPACTGLSCGDDSCGGSCGSCAAGEDCNAGQCVPACTPDCAAKSCGDDGCGGMCGDCGSFSCTAGQCDWPPTSYLADVVPIFETAECGDSMCHAGFSPKEGLDMRNATRAYERLVDVASRQCTDLLMVDPSNPSSSYLINKLTGEGMCDGMVMPRGPRSRLTPAQVDVVRAWIGLGAQND